MRHRIVVVGIALAVLAAGCGSGGGDKTSTKAGSSSTSTTSSSTSSSTSTTTTSTTKPCTFSGSTTPQQNALASTPQLLTDVTTATDGCTDTITFTFRPNPSPAPSYEIGYANGPFLDTAGRDVTPAGTAFLKVRFQPAWISDLSQPTAPLTYTGPKTMTPVGLKTVRGLALFDAFEAVVGWVVGLDAQHPFTVAASSAKVVITLG